MDDLVRLKKYHTYNFQPRKMSNINLMMNGEFFYLIIEKTEKGRTLEKAVTLFLKNRYHDITLHQYDTSLIKNLLSDQYIAFKVPQLSNVPKIIKESRGIQNIHYMGNIFVAGKTLQNPTCLLIFLNSKTVPQVLYDPPLVIKRIIHNEKKLNVISDNMVIGGTKTRAILPYLKLLFRHSPKINSLLYLGASNGYAQVAFAYSLYLLKSNITLKIYFQDTKLDEAVQLMKLAKYIYPHTKYVVLKKPFREIWPLIEKEKEDNPNAYHVQFGLNEEVYLQGLQTSLQKQLINYPNKIKTLWIVGGSGALFNTLYSVLPETIFYVVQVGKELNVDKERVVIHKSTYPLYSAIKVKVPYPTLKSYDGKIWEFMNEFNDGDYIWNVGGVNAIL